MALDSSKQIPSGREQFSPSGIDFELLVKLSNEAVILLEFNGKPFFISPAAERLFGWRAEKLAGHLDSLVHVTGSNANADLLQQILSGNGDPARPLPHADLQFRSAFGPVIWAEISTHLLESSAGTPYAFAVFLRSIAKRKQLEVQLEAATQTDPVTGLFNRRAFEDNLKREWAIALREKTHTSLIRVSLDRFDALAEHNGPAAAEDCLSRVAETLKDIARRPADITARTATSEFSILLPRTHELGAETISAYIHLAIRDLGIPNLDNGRGDRVVTASVGAACAVVEQTGVSESPDFILSAAENCVFQARQEGGNRVKTIMNVLAR
ncbi:diguanylate cyclase [Labrenzia sp. OB1]|uniref:GGDEF domain-containing protein n=1 Tax=Labrenzia sp. OB1 TaxID=1561204 RepID=UPI0007B24B45|nr:diguanylate cyclase [Labrenzia sp. OB1]KZM49227.1 diguanylate cyclase [Labrenzia sp. OB1]